MGAALLVCRLGLAAVFVVAGVAKLRDRTGARRAVVDFGAPEVLAGPLAVTLPLAELAVAILLLPASTARWGTLGSLALLAVFCAAIAAALVRGRAPDCHCFGQLHSEPAGWKALARNGLLAGLAGFVAVAGWRDPGPGAVGWISSLSRTEVVLLVVGAIALLVIAVGVWAVLHVLGAYGRVLVRLDEVEGVLAAAGLSELEPVDVLPSIGHKPGTEAPAFSLRDVRGDAVTLDGLLELARPLLLLFTSPTCGPCGTLMPTVSAWQSEHAEAITIALVSAGDPEAVRAETDEHDVARVLIDEELAVYTAYQANGTPSAVLVSPDGEIASWVASGSDWIERLVENTIAESAAAGSIAEDELTVGEPAPQFALQDLEGRRVELADFRGAETAFLFWNPACGFCRSMHEDLLAWEADPPAGAPGLVVVSSGESDATAEEGFASRVLLDGEFAAGGAFRAGGTPMAVRIDADGNVASPVVAGASAVLALLGVRPTTV